MLKIKLDLAMTFFLGISVSAVAADLDQRILTKVDRDHSTDVKSGQFMKARAVAKQQRAEAKAERPSQPTGVKATQLATASSSGPGREVPPAAKAVAKKPSIVTAAAHRIRAEKSGSSGGGGTSGGSNSGSGDHH